MCGKLHNNEAISTLQPMLIEKHVDYCQSYALGRQNLQAGLVVLKKQFRTCRIHLSLSTPLQSRDRMHKFIAKSYIYLFIYLFIFKAPKSTQAIAWVACWAPPAMKGHGLTRDHSHDLPADVLIAGWAEDDVLYFSNYPTDDRYDHRTIIARQVTYD